jgi:hypothetical protein
MEFTLWSENYGPIIINLFMLNFLIQEYQNGRNACFFRQLSMDAYFSFLKKKGTLTVNLASESFMK